MRRKMKWWNYKSNIPLEDERFRSFIAGFVFGCPASISKKTKAGMTKEWKTKYKTKYTGVSARQCSFRSNGVEKYCLTMILAHIKSTLALT